MGDQETTGIVTKSVTGLSRFQMETFSQFEEQIHHTEDQDTTDVEALIKWINTFEPEIGEDAKIDYFP